MSELADRIEKWRSQEGGKEDELYIELLVEAEEKLRELRARAEAAERRLAGAAGLLERCQWQHVTLEKVGAAPPEQLVADIRDFLATPSTEGHPTSGPETP